MRISYWSSYVCTSDLVGLYGRRGPRTILPLLERCCRAVDVPVAAMPVPYRTHHKEPTFQSLRDPECESLPMDMPFPAALDPFTCSRYEIADFTRTARDLGVSYFGVCCGEIGRASCRERVCQSV